VTADAEDALLLARARAGEPGAFARLYEAHHRRVYGLCLRLVADRAMAEDLTQDVFVKAWRGLEAFRGDARFATWLHRLTVNTVISHQRRRRPWFDRFRSAMDPASLPATKGAAALAHDLDAAIARLPARARAVFVLVDVEGYSHDEAGAALGIAAGTSKAQLHRARQLLRGMLI
jgi:RNA polymerase sigma-70 factor (ECF subfamily)